MAKKDQELLTLTEVSDRTDISMPTLGKYKKNYQDRIPSVGEGRKQRYPVEALDVFRQIKEENLARRGRPSKKESEKRDKKKTKKTTKKKKVSKTASDGRELLSLAEIGRRVDISYQTLLRYVDEYLDRIPHEGSGRRKKYPPEAIEVFREIYAESTGSKPARTGPGKSSSARASDGDMQQVLKAIQRLEKRLADVESQVKKPFTLKIER